MHVVILGNGIAGVTAALRLRQRQPSWRITLVSGESPYHFSRPALMYVFMGHLRLRDTLPYETHIWPQQRLELVQGWVEHVDTAQQRLQLRDGRRIAYDQLLLAVGSQPSRYGWPGQDLEGVQGFYSLQDLELLYENARGARSAVIVGGGLIGIELAEMLHARGLRVTILARDEHYWGNVLPPPEAAMVGRLIRAAGIDLRLKTELQRIEGDAAGRACAVVTSEGEHLPCELVGLTAGVRPNLSALQDSAVSTNRGILVDSSLRSDVPHVFAAGDCAEIEGLGGTGHRVEQVWYTGREQGRVVADVMAGDDVAYEPRIWFNSAKFLDLEYQIYGRVQGRLPGDESLYWEAGDGLHAVRVTHQEGAVVGFQLMGIRFRHEVCERWLHERRSVRDVLTDLPQAQFDPELFRRFEPNVVAAFREQLAS